MAAGLVLILALAGLAISLYFTLAYYGRVKKSRWVPEALCAPEDSSCVAVLRTPYARVFGVPNSLLGLAYYLLVLGWLSSARQAEIDWGGIEIPAELPSALLILITASTVLLGFHLILALRRKLRVSCPLCYTVHAINAALLILLILLAR